MEKEKPKNRIIKTNNDENQKIDQDMFNFIKEINSDLFDELNLLRSKSNKKIFTNQSLRDLMDFKPLSTKDMEDISNFDEEFIKYFGDQSSKIVSDHVNKVIEKYPKLIKIDGEMLFLLKSIQNRSKLISSENPEMNLKSLSKVQGYSIKNLTKNPSKLIENFINWEKIEEEKRIHIKIEIDEKDEEKYEKIIKRANTYNRFDTYIAFGSMSTIFEHRGRKEEFSAPLIFIPFLIKKDKGNIIFERDTKRNVKYNKLPFMLKSKVEKSNLKIDETEFSKIIYGKKVRNFENIVSKIEKFYESNEIKVRWPKTDIVEYKYVKPIKNKISLKNSAFIWRSDLLNSEVEHELEAIIESGFVTKIISEMFRKEDSEVRKELISNNVSEKYLNIREKLMNYGEGEIAQVNFLNHSQKEASINSKIFDNIIIQGPPGTGKTELIISLITDALARGKRVLVSSEKRIALDVIYSRLKDIARYSLIIDNIEDTSYFYNQINSMIEDAIIRNSIFDSDIVRKIFERDNSNYNVLVTMEKYSDVFQYLSMNKIGVNNSYLYKHHFAYRTKEKEILNVLENANFINILESKKMINNDLYENLLSLRDGMLYGTSDIDSSLDALDTSKYPWLIDVNVATSESSDELEALRELNQRISQGKRFKPWAPKKEIRQMISIIFKDFEILLDKKPSFEEFSKSLSDLEKSYKSFLAAGNLDNLPKVWSRTQNMIVNEGRKKGKEIPNDIAANLILDFIITKYLETQEKKFPVATSNFSSINSFNGRIQRDMKKIINGNIEIVSNTIRRNLIDKISRSDNLNVIQSKIQQEKNTPITTFLKEYWETVIGGINLFLLNPSAVSKILPLEPNSFDILIVDEASQMPIETSIPLVYRAKKTIIIGDDKQLPPEVDTKTTFYFNSREIELKNNLVPPVGLLDSLKNKYPSFQLYYHYRSKFEELIDFSNSFIYRDNLLVTTPHEYQPTNPPIEWIKINNGKFVGDRNIVEAKQVIKKLEEIVGEGTSKSVGIIALTYKQADEIRRQLKLARRTNHNLDLFIRSNEYIEGKEDTSLFIKSIEEIQGDERDIIIFSVTYSKSNKTSKTPSVLGSISTEVGERRINVAITRSKEKIIVVSSTEAGDLFIDDESDTGGKLFKNYLYYAQAVSSGEKQRINRILRREDTSIEETEFESLFHEDIYRRLKEDGYDVSYKEGNDRFVFDFVVRNNSGQRILAITTDSNQYFAQKNTEERDYHLPTYAQVRGWEISRIWSYRWSKNPDQEYSSLKQKIDSIISLNKNSLMERTTEFSRANLNFDNLENTKESLINFDERDNFSSDEGNYLNRDAEAEGIDKPLENKKMKIKSKEEMKKLGKVKKEIEELVVSEDEILEMLSYDGVKTRKDQAKAKNIDNFIENDLTDDVLGKEKKDEDKISEKLLGEDFLNKNIKIKKEQK